MEVPKGMEEKAGSRYFCKASLRGRKKKVCSWGEERGRKGEKSASLDQNVSVCETRVCVRTLNSLSKDGRGK